MLAAVTFYTCLVVLRGNGQLRILLEISVRRARRFERFSARHAYHVVYPVCLLATLSYVLQFNSVFVQMASWKFVTCVLAALTCGVSAVKPGSELQRSVDAAIAAKANILPIPADEVLLRIRLGAEIACSTCSTRATS